MIKFNFQLPFAELIIYSALFNIYFSVIECVYSKLKLNLNELEKSR